MRSSWYLVYVDPCFGSFPNMTLWDICGMFWVWWSEHEGCEWSIKNQSLLIREENILCGPIGWWLKEFLTRAEMNIRKSFYHRLSNHQQIEIHMDRYLGLTWFYVHGLFGMLYDWKIELYDNLSLKDIFNISIKFYIFQIGMTYC